VRCTTHSGDFVFGDSDDVIVIPQEITLEVLQRTNDIVEHEKKGRTLMRQGADMSEVKKELGVGCVRGLAAYRSVRW